MVTTLQQYEPLSDWVLLDPIDDKLTAGGIALPDNASISIPRAKVVKAGPGRITEYGERLPMPVAVGDLVLMFQPAHSPAIEIPIGSKSYALLRAQYLVCKVN